MFQDVYAELLVRMEDYYTEKGINELALRIVAGHYYAAQTGDIVLRVCAQEIDEESQTVSVFYIDHGDIETVSFACMYRLLPEFCEVPKQVTYAL